MCTSRWGDRLTAMRALSARSDRTMNAHYRTLAVVSVILHVSVADIAKANRDLRRLVEPVRVYIPHIGPKPVVEQDDALRLRETGIAARLLRHHPSRETEQQE